MTLEQAQSIYAQLVRVVKEFKSPAFQSYFLRKAHDDYKSLPKERSCAIKKYLEDQGDLLDLMKRQTVIYNMFYDKQSNI